MKPIFKTLVLATFLVYCGQALSQGTIDDKKSLYANASNDSLRWKYALDLLDATLTAEPETAQKVGADILQMAKASQSDKKLSIAYWAQSKLNMVNRDYQKVLEMDEISHSYAWKAKDTSLIVTTWLNIATNAADGDYMTRAMKEFAKCEEWLQKNPQPKFEPRFFYSYGAALATDSQNEKAIPVLQKSIMLNQSDSGKSRKQRSKMYLAQVYTDLNRNNEALQLMNEVGEEYASNETPKTSLGNYFSTFTNIYIKQKNYPAALEFSEKYKEVQLQKNLETDAAISSIISAQCLMHLNKNKEAFALAQDAEKTINAANHIYGQKALAIFYADYYSRTKNSNKAEQHFKKFESLLKRNPSTQDELSYYDLLGEHYLRNKQIQKADSITLLYAATAGEKLDKSTRKALIEDILQDYPDLNPRAKEMLSMIFENGGSQKLKALVKEKPLSSIFPTNEFYGVDSTGKDLFLPQQEEFANQLLELEKKYRTEKVENDLKKSQLEVDLEKERSARNKTLLIGSALVVILLAIIAIFLSKSRKKAIQDKEIIASLRDEVHHNARNNFELVEELIQKSEKLESVNLSLLKGRVSSIKNLHAILYRTRSMGEVPMKPFLQEISSAISEVFSHHYTVDFNIKSEITLDEKRAGLVGRVVGELVTNSYKYAFGETDSPQIEIHLSQKGNTYIFHYSDNGKGSDSIVSDSFGRKFIKATITTSLRGTMTTFNENGFHLTFEFPMAL